MLLNIEKPADSGKERFKDWLVNTDPDVLSFIDVIMQNVNKRQFRSGSDEFYHKL